jgi:Predicted restriction endonuclease
VCGFDFEKRYGAIGVGFIHVHHLVDIASIGGRYQVDPVRDLRPVCPNCHAMLHREKPALSIQELKRQINMDMQ